MNARRDPDRLVHDFLMEGQTELADQVFDAVRATIEHRHQRAVIGPWRMPDIMSKLVPFVLGGAALVAVLVIGSQLFATAAPGGAGAAPPAGGTVVYQLDGSSSTTVVDADDDGADLTGTAVTTSGSGTHTVALECAVRDGDTWAFGGTTEQTTLPGESAGSWSAVVVRDGSPQQIGIWLSDAKTEGIDCDGWLTGIGLAGIGAENFVPVESGALVPPPDLAP
jgi:hypothetical protein